MIFAGAGLAEQGLAEEGMIFAGADVAVWSGFGWSGNASKYVCCEISDHPMCTSRWTAGEYY